MANTNTEKIINQLKPEIVKAVSEKLSNANNVGHDIAIAWKAKQDDAVEAIKVLLNQYLKDTKITSPKSKSAYPDIKIENSEGLFAIDIKANEDSKNPWFDMARLDTIKESRIDKYVEEWELVIKFKDSDGTFIKAYFNLFREVVGHNKYSNGVKYRPYDGKIRPKTWADFENEVIYWNSKEEFLIGIENSIKYRWKSNIVKHLIPKLEDQEKDEFKKLFDAPIEIIDEDDEDGDID
ncbi:MAG TPA: hypothetical protein PLS10_06905 [Chitinophagales bacterium]|nr:hypothetical protein [Chitinophagales bacterium]